MRIWRSVFHRQSQGCQSWISYSSANGSLDIHCTQYALTEILRRSGSQFSAEGSCIQLGLLLILAIYDLDCNGRRRPTFSVLPGCIWMWAFLDASAHFLWSYFFFIQKLEKFFGNFSLCARSFLLDARSVSLSCAVSEPSNRQCTLFRTRWRERFLGTLNLGLSRRILQCCRKMSAAIWAEDSEVIDLQEAPWFEFWRIIL